MVVIKGVHAIKLGFVNAYLIEEPDCLTLIDCGIPPSGKKIRSYIESIGRPVKDLKHILITHADGDHIGSLAYLKRLSGARVYSSEAEAAGIKIGKSTRQVRFRGFMRFLSFLSVLLIKIKPVDVDVLLKDGDEIPVLGGLAALETPGHTIGHLSFYSRSPNILFSGDSLTSDSDEIHSSRPLFTWDPDKAGESFKKQLNLKPEIVCCGHGEVVRDAKNKFAAIK
jgi:glyoxylase-like metal-dependent hydrolase (beta-lactamase superfamily II)